MVSSRRSKSETPQARRSKPFGRERIQPPREAVASFPVTFARRSYLVDAATITINTNAKWAFGRRSTPSKLTG